MAQTESPNADAYQGVAGQEVGGGDSGDVAGVQDTADESVPSSDSGDRLPFTGAELGIFALVGFTLLATGLVMRRATRSGDTA